MALNVVNKGNPSPEQRATYNREEAIERVRYWQHAFGLDQMLIHISLIPGYNLEGHCQRYLGDMEAWIRIREDQRIGDMETTIVHEFLHILTQKWKDAYIVALKSMPNDLATMARNFISDGEESTIERLAELFVRVNGGEWWGARNLTVSEDTPPVQEIPNLKVLED